MYNERRPILVTYMSTLTAGRNYIKNFCQSIEKQQREGTGDEKENKN